MKRYLSCVILILLCVVCAMLFFVNAQNTNPLEDTSDSSSEQQNQSSTNKEPTDAVPSIEIEKSGTIYGDNITGAILRIEWAILKYESDPSLYMSCELYLDTQNQISQACTGYLSVKGSKKEFALNRTLGTSTLLSSYTLSLEFKNNTEIKFEGFVDVDISTASGIVLDGLSTSGTVMASTDYSNISSTAKIELEHISQFPTLPSGDEVTSLAMVLKYFGYNVNKEDLCDLYLDKGPVGFTDPSEANVGNPRDTYNSYGCLPPVIVKAANRYIEVNGGSKRAYDISGYNFDAILQEIAKGNPVIVWTCEDFDITPSISRVWVVNGKSVYLKSNTATMVLVGYDLIKNTVTLSNPAGNQFEIDLELFELRFSQMGAGAVVVK